MVLSKKSLLFSIMIFISIVAYGQNFAVDGINYFVKSNGLSVGISGVESSFSGDLLIPETVHCEGFGQEVESADWSLGSYWKSSSDQSYPAYQSTVFSCSMYNKEYTSSTATCKFRTNGTITFAVTASGMSSYYSNYVEIGEMDKNISSSARLDLINYYSNGVTKYYTFTPGDNEEHFVKFNGYVSTYGKVDVTVYVVDLPQRDYPVTSIDASAFSDCKNATTLVIPSGVTSIGNNAFKNCTGLTSICYNAKKCSDFASSNNVFYNAGKASTGIDVTIGKDVEKIPAHLFCPYSDNTNYSPKIQSVVFEEGSACQSIGESAFRYNPTLTSISLPPSIESIGSYAFYGCSGLTSIDIPNSMTVIKSYTFRECSALTTITIPSSVTSIESSAFYGCSALKKIYSLNFAPPTLGSLVFDKVDKNQTFLYVPKGSKEFYTKATQWKDFICIIEDADNEETRALRVRIETLEMENASLKTENDSLAAENATLKTEVEELSAWSIYDVNRDKKVSIGDVTTLVNVILNQSASDTPQDFE